MKYFEYRQYRRRLNFDKFLGFCFIIALIYAYSFIKKNNISEKQIIFFAFIILSVFFVLYIGKQHIKKRIYLKSPIAKIDKMEGIEFENYLKYIFEDLGYHVKLTPDTGDFGADLVLKKDSITTIIQAKRYTSHVGIASVQEIVAAKKYYNADECIVITNSYFTEAAKELAKANDVALMERKDLAAFVKKYTEKT